MFLHANKIKKKSEESEIRKKTEKFYNSEYFERYWNLKTHKNTFFRPIRCSFWSHFFPFLSYQAFCVPFPVQFKCKHSREILCTNPLAEILIQHTPRRTNLLT